MLIGVGFSEDTGDVEEGIRLLYQSFTRPFPLKNLADLVSN